jgi:hypothetical protein
VTVASSLRIQAQIFQEFHRSGLVVLQSKYNPEFENLRTWLIEQSIVDEISCYSSIWIPLCTDHIVLATNFLVDGFIFMN